MGTRRNCWPPRTGCRRSSTSCRRSRDVGEVERRRCADCDPEFTSPRPPDTLTSRDCRASHVHWRHPRACCRPDRWPVTTQRPSVEDNPQDCQGARAHWQGQSRERSGPQGTVPHTNRGRQCAATNNERPVKNEEQRKLDSLIRVQDFIAKNPDLVGPISASAAARQVHEAVAQIREHITAQGATALMVQGQTGRVTGMAKNIARVHLVPIAKFARATLSGVPEYATLAQRVRTDAPKTLVSHAYAVAKAAAPYVDTLVAAGFPADTIDRLVAATNELNEAIMKREPLAATRVQSTVSIVKLIAMGREGVRKMDAVLANRLSSNAPALAAWKAASRVQLKTGSVRKPAETEDLGASSLAGVAAE